MYDIWKYVEIFDVYVAGEAKIVNVDQESNLWPENGIFGFNKMELHLIMRMTQLGLCEKSVSKE